MTHYDEIVLDQLLAGMEDVSNFILRVQDASDDLEQMRKELRKVDRILHDIVDLPGQLLEQIDEVLT